MSARAWQRRRAGQWPDTAYLRAWVPQHPGMISPEMEWRLYGSVCFLASERRVDRARRLRIERLARRRSTQVDRA